MTITSTDRTPPGESDAMEMHKLEEVRAATEPASGPVREPTERGARSRLSCSARGQGAWPSIVQRSAQRPAEFPPRRRGQTEAGNHRHPDGARRRPATQSVDNGSVDPRVHTVVIADDDMLLREGVASLLDRSGFEVVDQAANAAALLALVRRHRPDLVNRRHPLAAEPRDRGARRRPHHPRVAARNRQSSSFRACRGRAGDRAAGARRTMRIPAEEPHHGRDRVHRHARTHRQGGRGCRSGGSGRDHRRVLAVIPIPGSPLGRSLGLPRRINRPICRLIQTLDR